MDRDEILEGLSTVLGVTVSQCGGTLLPVTQLTQTVYDMTSAKAHRQDFSVKENEFFDPKYDYDFRGLEDSSECERGGEHYKRPVGWNRVALKVRGKYKDGDSWMGRCRGGWRNESIEGEWPVAFHGTTFHGAKGIIREGFRAGPRAVYGRGVYCTPDINVAERDGYAQIFTSQKSGKTYKVALQSRINPQYREVCDEENEYWRIPVKKGLSAEEERDIVDKAIRPYGILFKKIEG